MNSEIDDFQYAKLKAADSIFNHKAAQCKQDFDKHIRELYKQALDESQIISLQTINLSLRGKVSGRIEDTGQRIARLKRERKRAKSKRTKRRR